MTAVRAHTRRVEYVQPGDARRRAVPPAASEGDAAPTLPTWPVFDWADAPGAAWLGGWERLDDTLHRVEIVHGDKLVIVRTELADDSVDSLDRALAEEFRDAGLDYPVPGVLPRSGAPRARPTELEIDGTPVEAVVQQVGEFVAWRAEVDGTVVTITARGPVDASVHLVRVTDLADLVHGREQRIAARRAAHVEDEPLTGPDGTQPLWAHRGLVEMVLATHTRQAEARKANRPAPQLDPDWRRRWDAAVRRQQQLREEDAAAAHDSVAGMINQLTALQEEAAWWGTESLRVRAVDQIIWVTATGEENVGSAPAQREWRLRWNSGHGTLRSRAAARRQVLALWQDWADAQG